MIRDHFTAPPIDIQVLLGNSMQQALFAASILDDFSQSVVGRLEVIESHLRREDFQAVELMAHSLKGVAGLIGATQLFKVNADIQAAHQKTGVVSVQLFERLQQEIQHVVEAIPHLCTTLRLEQGVTT